MNPAERAHTLCKDCDYLLGQRVPLSAYLNLYLLIVSCQRHGRDPLAYLKDILTTSLPKRARLPRMTNQDDLRQLTPRLWQPNAS